MKNLINSQSISLKVIWLSAAVVAAASLAACGDSKISAVKDTRMSGEEFTVGQTLGKIDECKSTDWTSEVVNNATVVTHTCTVKLSDDVVEKAKLGELSALKVRANLAATLIQSDVRSAQTVKAEAVRRNEERETQVARKLAEMDAEIKRAATAEWMPFISLEGKPMSTRGTPPDPAVWEAKRQENVAKLTQNKQAFLDPFEAERRRNQQSMLDYQKDIDERTEWGEKYAREAQTTYAAVAKEVDDYYGRSHNVTVRTVFGYREGAPAQLFASSFSVDGGKPRDGTAVYLMDPKRMKEYLVYMTKSGLGMDSPSRFDERFPIESVPSNVPGVPVYRYKAKKADA